jgi:formylglycine-generating enzyme required for sulfatase activity
MKKLYMLLAAVLIIIVGMGPTGCGSDSNPIPKPKSSEKAITSFSLNEVIGTINETEKTIAVAMPFGTDVTAMVATFTTNGASVKVGETIQVSGTTANDFTNQVTYTVTAADATTQDYTVVVTVAKASAKAITTFSLAGFVGAINEAEKTIAVTLPFGSPVTNRIAKFTTTGDSVKVGSIVQVSGTTLNNFTNPVVYTVVAADSSTQDYTVTVTVALSSAKAITSFSLNGSIGTINETNKTIAVTMPFGTYIMDLVETFTTTGVSVKVGSTVQISGTTAHNFTSPVTYTVVAADSSTQDYIVTVTVSPSPAKAITAFSLKGVAGTINETAKTIAVTMPYGTDVTALVATFITTGASVKVGSTVQISGTTAHNFTSSVTYTVTAADSSTQDYTVTVTVALNPAKAITAFTFPISTGTTIDEVAHTIAVTVPFGTVVTALVPTITHTGASINPDTDVANDFTSSVVYTVTAADSSTQDYTVTVTVSSGDYTSAHIGTLKYVPAGSFQRDSTSTNISTVSAFRMSQYEITRAQFLAIMGTDPSNTTYSTGTSDPVQQTNWYHAIAFCNKLSIAEGLTPVYSVSGVNFSTLTYAAIPTSSDATWDAATADWSANGYRLPTEMEWMWAAMGATAGATGYLKAFAGSTGSNAIGDYAWTEENSSVNYKSQPVGTKLPNELGLYDMSGNVWEWCWDWYDSYSMGTQTNYRGAASGTSRVLRGGSWTYLAFHATVAYRFYLSPYTQSTPLGFRVVRL